MIGITKGSTLIIRKAARPYVCAGFRSVGNDLPAEEDRVTVLKVTKTKRGRKAHVRNESYGYAIMLDDLPSFMSVEVVDA